MRCFALLGLIIAATFGTASALVDASSRTTVTVDANAWDPREKIDNGCLTTGCLPELTRDGRRFPGSRWSCSEDLAGENCEITYYFEEPQDIVEMRIAFYKDDERTRKLKIKLNGRVYDTVESSGNTLRFETFQLDTDETESLTLEALGLSGDEWISITEVRFMVL